MANFHIKILIVVATVLFLPCMQGSALERYTEKYPIAKQIGIGATAGIFGAGLGSKYGNPYVTATAGAVLTALLAKKAWNTVSLPKIKRNYWPMALSAFGGIGSGVILTKLLQNKGWNPYILASAAAGTGALCGLGAQYTKKYLDPERKVLEKREVKEEKVLEKEEVKEEDEKNLFIAQLKKDQLSLKKESWLKAETYLLVLDAIKKDALKLPLTNDEKELIKRSNSVDMILEILENRLEDRTKNLILMKNVELDNFDSWSVWAKEVINSDFNKQIIFEHFSNDIPNYIQDYLRADSMNEKNINKKITILMSSKNKEDFIEKIRNSEEFAYYVEQLKGVKRKALIEEYRKTFPGLSGIHALLYEKDFVSAGRPIGSRSGHRKGMVGDRDRIEILSKILPNYKGEPHDVKSIIQSIYERYNLNVDMAIQKEKKAILTWLIADAFGYLNSIEGRPFTSNYDSMLELFTALYHIKNISQIDEKGADSLLGILSNWLGQRETVFEKPELKDLAAVQAIKKYLFDVENELNLLDKS